MTRRASASEPPASPRFSNGRSGRLAGSPAAQLSRRSLFGCALAVGANALREDRSAVLAHGEDGAFASVELPPELGQSDLEVYFETTGHTLRGLFLDYWRANGGAHVYGLPISEPFAAADGYYSQAFERGVFQYRPEFLYTADPVVRLMPIGRLGLLARLGLFPGAPRGGDGEAATIPWRPLAPDSRAVARVLDAGGVFVEETGHTIAGDILAWYRFNEGAAYLGPPLTEPAREGEAVVQWFAGGLLRSDEGGVSLAPLDTELAPGLGIDTASVPRGDRPIYDESLFWTADNPNPLGDPGAPGARWVEVILGEQRLLAYQGDTLVSASLVSTGRGPNPTELGFFHVRLKYPEQDMRGFTAATGEVLPAGDAAAAAGAVPYEVKAVPHVMYFNMDAEALHGAYWHDNFGAPMSLGCVNLPLDVAAWMYGWAPLGTAVLVRE